MSLKEALAAYAHKSWSWWMQYLFSKVTYATDGAAIIPKELVQRWKRQMTTEYLDLPESEKASDRTQADNMLEVFQSAPSSRFRSSVLIDVEATALFENENINWQYCKQHASFSHKHACEFILHGGEAEFTARKVKEMQVFGCTKEFIDTYVAAVAAGATRVLFYV